MQVAITSFTIIAAIYIASVVLLTIFLIPTMFTQFRRFRYYRCSWKITFQRGVLWYASEAMIWPLRATEEYLMRRRFARVRRETVRKTI